MMLMLCTTIWMLSKSSLLSVFLPLFQRARGRGRARGRNAVLLQ